MRAKGRTELFHAIHLTRETHATKEPGGEMGLWEQRGCCRGAGSKGPDNERHPGSALECSYRGQPWKVRDVG